LKTRELYNMSPSRIKKVGRKRKSKAARMKENEPLAHLLVDSMSR
jgi:hypothetical protein